MRVGESLGLGRGRQNGDGASTPLWWRGGKAQMGVPPPATPSTPHKHLLAISPWRKTHGTEAAVETFNRSLTKHHFNSCSRSPHCVFFIFIFSSAFYFVFYFFILSFIFFSLYFFFFSNSGTFLFLSFSIFFNSPWNDHLFFYLLTFFVVFLFLFSFVLTFIF